MNSVFSLLKTKEHDGVFIFGLPSAFCRRSDVFFNQNVMLPGYVYEEMDKDFFRIKVQLV
ncbi:MAG TPA: hypothetical protein DDX92_06455 [Flavobacteriales bacterium]|nr:hypothetical protein [Flavobacteriales bacterium]